MAASLETRVRVDRLLRLMAMVWPRRAERMVSDWVLELNEDLWKAAFRTKVVCWLL